LENSQVESDLDKTTQGVTEIVEVLHKKNEDEERATQLELLDAKINDIKEKIQKLNDEKHDLVSTLKLVLNEDQKRRQEKMEEQKLLQKRDEEIKQQPPPPTQQQQLPPSQHPQHSSCSPSTDGTIGGTTNTTTIWYHVSLFRKLVRFYPPMCVFK